MSAAPDSQLQPDASPALMAVRSSALFGVLETVCPGINEAFTTLVRDVAESKQTKPACPHGNAFCDDDWLPTHPACGCKPTMAQIYVMTHYALSPNDQAHRSAPKADVSTKGNDE